MKKLSTHAHAAKLIRQELKKAFPTIKFSVTSQTYSMGNSIDVNWSNGPCSNDVNLIIRKYQQGHFNGMNDCYEISNRREDIPQVKYVFANREISLDIFHEAFEYCKGYLDGWDDVYEIDQYHTVVERWGVQTAKEFIWRNLIKADLTHGFKEAMIA